MTEDHFTIDPAAIAYERALDEAIDERELAVGDELAERQRQHVHGGQLSGRCVCGHTEPTAVLADERQLLQLVTEGLDLSGGEAAAAELVNTSMWGDLVEVVKPWTSKEGRVDWHRVAGALDGDVEQVGYLSGGQEAILRIAASLVTGAPVDLRNAIGRLDRTNRRAAVRAIAKAARVPLAELV